MHQEFMYHHQVPLPLSLVQSFYYIAQQREGLHPHFSGTEMDSLILLLLHYQCSKCLYLDHHRLIVLYITVLLLIQLEEKLSQIMLALIFKVREDDTVYSKFYYAIVCCLVQLLYQLKDHVLQTMEDVIKFVLMSLELYDATVKLDTSVLQSCLQNALVSLKL